MSNSSTLSMPASYMHLAAIEQLKHLAAPIQPLTSSQNSQANHPSGQAIIQKPQTPVQTNGQTNGHPLPAILQTASPRVAPVAHPVVQPTQPVQPAQALVKLSANVNAPQAVQTTSSDKSDQPIPQEPQEPTDQAQEAEPEPVSPKKRAPEERVKRIQNRLQIEINDKTFAKMDEIKYDPRTGRPVRTNRRAPTRLVLTDSVRDKKHQQYEEEEVVIDLKTFDENFKRAIRESEEFGQKGGFQDDDLEDMEDEDRELDEHEEELDEDEEFDSEEAEVAEEEEADSEDSQDGSEEDEFDEAEESSAYETDSDQSSECSSEYSRGSGSSGTGESASDPDEERNHHEKIVERSQGEQEQSSEQGEPEASQEDDMSDFIASDDEFPEWKTAYGRMEDPVSEDDPDEGEGAIEYIGGKKKRKNSNKKRQAKKNSGDAEGQESKQGSSAESKPSKRSKKRKAEEQSSQQSSTQATLAWPSPPDLSKVEQAVNSERKSTPVMAVAASLPIAAAVPAAPIMPAIVVATAVMTQSAQSVQSTQPSQSIQPAVSVSEPDSKRVKVDA